MSAINNKNWLYVKMYLGNAQDKSDDMLVELGRLASQQSCFSEWFFIRYFDESGFHIRFRVKVLADQVDLVQQAVTNIWTTICVNLANMLPSQYTPMVDMPSFGASSFDFSAIPKVINAVYAEYEPEHDKFGGTKGIAIAERLFSESSAIAYEILKDESKELYSRKTLAPLLMVRCFEHLKIRNAADYWRQYSQFWLGGDTPAAEDQREYFFAKGKQLMEAGIPILDPISELPTQAISILERWDKALIKAYTDYQAISGQEEFSYNVLCFNFSHLMLNRLGLTSIEESYMAALLEQIAASEEISA